MDFSFEFPFWGQAFLAFIASLFFSLITIPVVINVSLAKGLFDEPNGRSSHQRVTPTLGGVAVFISLILTYLLVGGVHFVPAIRYLFASLLIIFFIGIKDDILVIAPIKKLLAQLFASLIVIIMADIRIGSLHGVVGIYEIPYIASVVLSLFVYVVMINAINLVDGIDGLAGGLGIVMAGFLGVWFYVNGAYSYALLSVILIASLIGFLRFNFSREQKIFMGDTGSLLLGFVLAVLNIQFLRMHELPEVMVFSFKSAPAMAVLLFAIPLFDTLRVFTNRISERRSPFFPDRNHIHHIFIDKGLQHWKATALICICNVLYVLLFTYIVEALSPSLSCLFIFGLFLIYAYVLNLMKMPPTSKMFVKKSVVRFQQRTNMRKRA
ncbi:MraY family glycosyltransferase [Persicobacter psychrovividus]|uniref:Undecaprenyl-phosphate alpha-N-acetylglucosaminyl 1-phosphate transferase n=1 Tax=Persicobacter psychrovividus TaxID=387638 RepID=A0ABN6L628_9BACT|nr:undecaprenyl-phosphate alpha-N-acetylglucosaminyl 1-phosphate transferase [Persicobacter psychrovividus]